MVTVNTGLDTTDKHLQPQQAFVHNQSPARRVYLKYSRGRARWMLI